MAEQWGAPLTGAQMKLLRLPDGVLFRSNVNHLKTPYRFVHGSYYYLPTDNPAYTLLKAGWLDGRNVRLWFGGDKAPDDWGCGDVLLENGRICPAGYWWHDKCGENIIAYIAKDEVPRMELTADAIDPSKTPPVQRVAPQPETVTIAKMTEAEASAWASKQVVIQPEHPIVMDVLGALSLIKETTREERFWAIHEPEGTTVPTHIKKWVKDALEFEQ